MNALAGWPRGARAPSWMAVVAILLAGCAAPPPAPRPQVQTPAPAPAPAPATSVDEARRYLQARPDPYATFREAERYRTAGNKEAVFLLVKYAARNGVPEAEHEMGRYYDPATYRESGIIRNPQAPRAGEWYRSAAAKDHVPSMVRLGQMYGDGLIQAPSGTSPLDESLRLLNRAAQLGSTPQARRQVPGQGATGLRGGSAGGQQGLMQSKVGGHGSGLNTSGSGTAARVQSGMFDGHCDWAGAKAMTALKTVEASSHRLDSAAGNACEAINNAVVSIWANRECLKDPKFTNSQRIQIREQIKAWEDNLTQWETTHEKLTAIGAACPCVTDPDICDQGIAKFEHQSRSDQSNQTGQGGSYTPTSVYQPPRNPGSQTGQDQMDYGRKKCPYGRTQCDSE